ncbi:hypothetical protein D5018_13880 [Parashewanella curva]|uniref:Uncharacterized protein n=1 Tax=Parashewanella curva TaxID=2338552 RepID=A0A3L8PUV2_9GAMM|nr:carboxymuconolactone decarboxylase family protein [Parashewanella curva]RLV59096.1 hypothetical protein D5018_13880 [Parashewanella curva]
MQSIKKLLDVIPALEDQLSLFTSAAFQETFLSSQHRKLVAWSAACASQSEPLLGIIKVEFGELSQHEQKLVFTASSRMAVTNPYFMSRNIHPLQAGGSLSDLKMRPFQQLNIEDDTGYHYACIAISLINNGFVCFNSHLNSLKSSGQTDEAIDQALRLVASIQSLKQALFNEKLLNNLSPA